MLKIPFLLLVLFSGNVASAIYKCTDPVTNKVGFTDKPCSSKQLETEIGKKAVEKPGPESMSAQELVSRLNEIDDSLNSANFRLENRPTLEGESQEHWQILKGLVAGHRSWKQNRDENCYKQYGIKGVPIQNNQELLRCKITQGEERAAQYLDNVENDSIRHHLMKAQRPELLRKRNARGVGFEKASVDTTQYENLSIPELQEALNKSERHLNEAREYLASSSTPGGNNPEISQLLKMLKSEHNVWYENRNGICDKQFGVRGVDSNKNQQVLICKIGKTEERISAYLQYSEDGTRSGLLTGQIKRTTLMPGKEGLVSAVRDGLITVAKESDMAKWMKNAGVANLSPVISHSEKYLVTDFIRLSGGLAGANSVVFLVNDSTMLPTGNPDHSLILIIDTGSCLGRMCSMLAEN